MLEHLKPLDKDALTTLLINWYRRQGQEKYKVPIFAHQELDLHRVFWEVQDRGGYEQVTALKQWKVGYALRVVPLGRLSRNRWLYCVILGTGLPLTILTLTAAR